MRAILLWVFTGIFLLFAAWQYNDPDPLRWAAMYGYTAVCFGLTALGKQQNWLFIAGLVISGIWMATLLPDFIDWVKMGAPTITGTMKAESPHVELTREFLGLLICCAGYGSLLWLGRKKAS